MRGTATDGTRNYGSRQLMNAAAVALNGSNMTSNTDPTGTIHRWIERKPLAEAVPWTAKEKFWLIISAMHYGINDWKAIAQVVKNAGLPYRPKEWYSSKNCQRQFKNIITNISKELKLLPFTDMLKHIAEVFKKDYIQETKRSNEALKDKYLQLTSIVNRIKQGNLSRSEVTNLYSQAKSFETDGKQYLEELMAKQTDCLASENQGSEEPIKWNTPSAPLLTSLLKSHNTIPANKTVTTINSLMQTPGGTSRTRSGKLLPLSSSIRTIQGTPTLSKLLEAPANPYIPNSPQSIQKNKSSDVIATEKFVESTSKKEIMESLSVNRLRVDTIPESINQINKSDLSLKRQPSMSPISGDKNGSKVDLNIINLISDSESEESNSPIRGIQSKNLFGDKKDISNSKIEQRATRSQTRAEGGFKQPTDNKLSSGKKEEETLQQKCEESRITDPIDDDIIDIDQIDVEPLPLIPDDLTTQIPTKVTRSSMQRLRLNTPAENVIKINSKEISNQMLEEISANFVLNSTSKNVATEYKNIMVGQSRIDNSNISGCFIPLDSTTLKDTILLRKDGQPFSNPVNTLTTFDGKLLRQKRIIELKGANIRCIDGRTDKKIIFANQPIMVVNKIKKPFNIKLSSEPKDKLDINQSINNDSQKSIKLHSNSQNLVQLLDDDCSFNDDVIIIDDDVNINAEEEPLSKIKEASSSKVESKESHLTILNENDNSNNSKTISYLDKISKNDKTPWNMFAKTQNSVNICQKRTGISDASKIKNSNETSNSFIKELDFDFDQSISQTSLTELYNGVEEIVEMHAFDNEELNSLIDCGTLNNSVTEECQNFSDQNDSSVSESDSTIGAFDTFAQITRVPHRSSKSLNKEPTTVLQTGGGKDIKHDEGFVQSDEIDDQNTAVSVTGIPILQGVISDVMSKIDSDRVAALKDFEVVDRENTLANDVVEISSDEEESENQLLTNLEQLKTKESENVMKNLNIDESIKMKEKSIEIIYNDCKSDAIVNQKIEHNVENKEEDVEINEENNEKNNDCIITKHEVINVKNSCGMKDTADNKINSECIQSNEIIITTDVGNIKEKLSIKTKIENELEKVKEAELKTTEEYTKHNTETLNITKDAYEKLNKQVEEETLENDEIIKDTQVKETKKKEFEAEIMQRAHKQIEIKMAKLVESSLAKEADTKKMKETEIKKAKEAEMKIAKEADIVNPKKVGLLKKSKVPEYCGIKEVKVGDKIQHHVNVIDLQRLPEVQIKRVKETEIQRIQQAQIQRAKDAEIKRTQVIELQRTEEEEIRKGKKTKMIELKDTEIKKAKNVKVQDIEIKKAGKKSKEVEILNVESKKRGDSEKRLQDKEKEMLVSDDQLKKTKILEQSELEIDEMDEIRSNNSEEEAIKTKEQEIKKYKEVEIKLITRTRGLKVEEEKQRSTIRSSSTIKSTLSSVNSSEINKDEYVEHEVSDKWRTRSLISLKPGKKSENKNESSYKSKDQNEIDILSEKLKKRRTPISQHDIPNATLSLKNNTIKPVNESMRSLLESNCNSIAVVVLDADEVPNILERGYYQVSDNTIKPIGIKAVQNDAPNPSNPLNSPKTIIVDDEKPKKPLPKKRGRKRRIGLSNEELQQQSNSVESTLQNGATILDKTSCADEYLNSEINPLPAKRTRSIESCEENKENGSYDEIHIDKKLRKKVLNIIYDSLYKYNKYLSILESQVTDMSPENNIIIKTPIELQNIQRKISLGEIKNISQLEIELMLMSYNVTMINKTNTTAYEDATDFQGQFKNFVESLKGAIIDQSVGESQDTNNVPKNISMVHSTDDDFNSDDLLISDENEDDHHQCIDSNTSILKSDKTNFFKNFDISSDDSTDSQYESPPYKKRKTKCTSSNNSSDSNDSNDSNSDADSNYN